MPIKIENKTQCTGCEACANACPKKCITMAPDICGFVYPSVDASRCINCEICKQVCPIIDSSVRNIPTLKKSEVYACWSLDSDTRYNSTSGGMFSELAEVILKKGGVIVGAAYNQDCEVVHILARDEMGLESIRQSKYTQSRIGGVYSTIKDVLENGQDVMFCGAPCQVAGLLKFLGKRYENLTTVDFICRGVNSPKAYRAWLSELEKQYGSRAKKVWFKYKINGWKKSPKCTRVDFENGKVCVQSELHNTYMSGYLGPNLYIRPSCSDCQFKSEKRNSDITLADFWGIAKQLDDDKGTSLVLLNSEKGKELFAGCKDKLFVEQRDIEEIEKGNVCFNSSVSINPKSEEFLKKLDGQCFSRLIKEYTNVPFYKKLRRQCKRLVRKIIR